MARHFTARLIFLLALIIFGWISPRLNAGQTPSVAVVYPDLQEPYRGVLSAIIEGIQEQSTAPVTLFPIEEGFDTSRLKESINRTNISAIVALGRTGLAAAKQWQCDCCNKAIYFSQSIYNQEWKKGAKKPSRWPGNDEPYVLANPAADRIEELDTGSPIYERK